MTFWLKTVERQVQARAGQVRADTAALATARRRFATSLRRDLARPKVLLAIFAAGLGVGWLRGPHRDNRRHAAVDTESEDAEVTTGRIAKIVAAVLAGARIYEQARRAIAFLDEHSRDRAIDRRAAYGHPPDWAGAESRSGVHETAADAAYEITGDAAYGELGGAAYGARGDAAQAKDRDVGPDSPPVTRRASSASGRPSAAARD